MIPLLWHKHIRTSCRNISIISVRLSLLSIAALVLHRTLMHLIQSLLDTIYLPSRPIDHSTARMFLHGISLHGIFFNEHGLTRKDTETLRGVNSPPWIRRGRGGLIHGILFFCTNYTNYTNGVYVRKARNSRKLFTRKLFTRNLF